MGKLAELATKGNGILSELEVLKKKLDGEKDEAMRKTIEETIAGKTKEYDALKGKIDDEKASLERRKALAQAMRDDKELHTAIDGKDLKTAAQALDHERKEASLRNAMVGWLQGKSVPTELMEEFRPKSSSFKEAADGMRMPDSLAQGIFGKSFLAAFGGKTYTPGLPQTTEDPCMTSVVAPEYKRQLLELPAEPTSLLSQVTSVPATGGSAKWPRLVQDDDNEYGGVEVDWIEEGGEKPDAEACFEQLTIQCYELAGYTELSHTLLRRSIIDLEPILTRLFRGAIFDALTTAILTSLGAASPTGIIPTAGIHLVPRRAAGTVDFGDLVNLKYALRSYHRGPGRFAIQDTIAQALEIMLVTSDPPVLDGLGATLVGKPWESTHRLPAIGVEGDAIYGNFKEYILAVEQEVVLRRSEHYKFKTNVEAFSVYMVVGGKVAQPRAFAILDDDVES